MDKFYPGPVKERKGETYLSYACTHADTAGRVCERVTVNL